MFILLSKNSHNPLAATGAAMKTKNARTIHFALCRTRQRKDGERLRTSAVPENAGKAVVAEYIAIVTSLMSATS